MNETLQNTLQALLSPSQVSEVLKLSRRQVLRLPIKQVRLGVRTIRFRKEDLDAYIKDATRD